MYLGLGSATAALGSKTPLSPCRTSRQSTVEPHKKCLSSGVALAYTQSEQYQRLVSTYLEHNPSRRPQRGQDQFASHHTSVIREDSMADRVNPATRSKIMSAVPTKNTSLELTVRKLLTKRGYRYRLHRKDLPGTPDIVFPGRKKAIFVNGCFWHQHPGCIKARPPKSRQEYWVPKLGRNAANDERNQRALEALSWQVLVIWQCESKDASALDDTLVRFLAT